MPKHQYKEGCKDQHKVRQQEATHKQRLKSLEEFRKARHLRGY